MGYTTTFSGQFNVTPTLEERHRLYLKKFNETRRMRRDRVRASALPDPLREGVDLSVGPEGAFFVGGEGYAGQDDDISVDDHNAPPGQQPGLWCKWTPSDDGGRLKWDGAEKFQNYVTWLRYLVDTFLEPWGYKLNGEVTWEGEDPEDVGTIRVKDNEVTGVTKERLY